jgi:autotransporter strand-loop-strand O-heptosyltransferase
MKICHVTPGLISIPPNGWGAIEKIIWEYKINSEKLGHVCDIKYLNDVNKNDYDIVHIHVANLALMAHERGIPYVFTMHDHHTEHFGKDSFIYKQNKEAIDKSVLSFVPAQHLVEFFDSHKVKYLRHGVNTSFFKPSHESDNSNKLLCVGNNGLCGDVTFDRKGFIYAIEAARSLNMELTIAGPDSNKKFFELNTDYKPYEKLKFLYNLSEDELKNVYQTHNIFLHPSSVEAGHPNLTLMEAMACGLPLVSTYDSDPLPGMKKIERSVESVKNGIVSVMNEYSSYRESALKTAISNDWIHVVSDLCDFYSKNDNFRMRNELMDVYNSVSSASKQTQKANVSVNFTDGAFISIAGGESNREYDFQFSDVNTKEIFYSGKLNTNSWSRCFISRFVPYNINVQSKGETIMDYNLNLSGQPVLVIIDSTSLGDAIAWFPYIEEFRKKHNCDITCSTNWNELFQENYPNVKFIPLNWNGDFYAIYKLGCYDNKERSLFNYKNVSLSHISSSILGLDPVEIKPNIVVRDKNRRISNKYVCFTTESTAQAKLWNNPTGWQETINYLNSINLQPVLIQLGENNSFKNIRNLSGKKSIHDTINYLYNCEFFVGIGSGLSWLAWALNKPVVMISGFSNPQSEFFTPYRVINPNVCNSCWNEYPFDKGDWNWCPRQKGTERQFECSKLISSKMVIDKIDQICPK